MQRSVNVGKHHDIVNYLKIRNNKKRHHKSRCSLASSQNSLKKMAYDRFLLTKCFTYSSHMMNMEHRKKTFIIHPCRKNVFGQRKYLNSSEITFKLKIYMGADSRLYHKKKMSIIKEFCFIKALCRGDS